VKGPRVCAPDGWDCTDWQTADVEIERRTKISRAGLRITSDLARDCSTSPPGGQC
jgi:hypothetical protein